MFCGEAPFPGERKGRCPARADKASGVRRDGGGARPIALPKRRCKGLGRPAVTTQYNLAMRILIANDDGYLAPGLQALVTACEGLGDLDIVAPEQNASGTSNSLTLNRPLSVYRAANGFRYINGTPSDCVHVALTGLLEHKPDLVVSGINNGANMGDDTHLLRHRRRRPWRAILFGIPAIAFLAGASAIGSHLDECWPARHGPSWCISMQQQRSRRCQACGCSMSTFRCLPYDQICCSAKLMSPRDVAMPSEPVIKQLNPRGETDVLDRCGR